MRPGDNSPIEDIVAEMVQLFQLDSSGEDHFTGPRRPYGIGRVFGGQVIAQALAAAMETVGPDRPVHSLHAYFLRGGSEDHDIEYQVHRDLDGRSFCNRRVQASQDGHPILSLSASFQRDQGGPHHELYPMPDVPPPEELRSDNELRNELVTMGDSGLPPILLRTLPIDLRPVQPRQWLNPVPREAKSQTWFRAAAPLPDDQRIHQLTLAYASDMQLLGTALLPHALSWRLGKVKLASLDHAVWFHAPIKADDWLLYVTDSPWSGGSRGYNRGLIYNRAGALVASTCQEGMIRVVAE